MRNMVLLCETSGILPPKKHQIRAGMFGRLLILIIPALLINSYFYAQ